MSDSLLQRIAAGDMSAMKACIDQYGGLAWSLARRMSVPDPEDAVQEVFIALWENAGRFDPEKGSEVTFVATIARRHLIDRGRRGQRRKKAMAALREQTTDRFVEPDDSIPVSEEVRQAREAMAELSEDQRKVLTLAIHYGATHEQIARQTGLPLGTVKTHARRGLMRVREKLRGLEARAAGEGSA